MNSTAIDQSRMQFFSIALLLKAVAGPDAIKSLVELHDSCSDRGERAGLLFGYKLVVEALLFKELELIVRLPEILHLPLDEDLFNWWSSSEAKSSRSFKFSTDAETRDSVFVANQVNDLLLQVVRSGMGWDLLVQSTSSVLTFALTVLSIGRDLRLVLAEQACSEQKQEIDRALRFCAAELLHDLIYDDREFTFDDVYDYANPNWTEWVDGSLLEDLSMLETQTSRDHIGIKPGRRGNTPRFMGLGINIAAQVALESLTNQRRANIRLDKKILPKEEIFGNMIGEFQPGKWPSTKYSLRFQAEPPREELKNIMLSDISPPDPEEYLHTLLGNNAFLANGGGVNAERHIRALILGLTMTQDASSLVRVLQIEHAGSPENPHPPVSLAVRVGTEWQVFYRIDAVGRMKSWVWPFLRSLEGQVEVTPIEGINAECLLSLCDRAFQYVSRQLKAQKDLNSHLRGRIPELLATLLLVHDRHFPARCSFQIDGIGDLDAVGYKESLKDGQLRVVEVKKQSTTQIELQSEILEFADKMRKIREATTEVEQALGCPGPIREVSGLFISMAVVGEFDEEAAEGEEADSESNMGFFDSQEALAEFRACLAQIPGLEFWDYNRFDAELRKADLPVIPIRLLEDVDLTWELPDLELEENTDI